MRKHSKAELQKEARSLRKFVTDPHLIGWLWPWDHARIVTFLKEVDRDWFQKNQSKILPPVPVQFVEQERAEMESGYRLLV